MHYAVRSPHLAQVGDTVESPRGVLQVLSRRVWPPQSGHPRNPAEWALELTFRNQSTGEFHRTWLPEPAPVPFALPVFQILYGNTRVGYTLCGPFTTPTEGKEQARAEALLKRDVIDFAIDGTVLVTFDANGNEAVKS